MKLNITGLYGTAVSDQAAKFLACRWPPAKFARRSAQVALVHALHYSGPCLRLGDSIAVESRCTSVTIRRHTST